MSTTRMKLWIVMIHYFINQGICLILAEGNEISIGPNAYDWFRAPKAVTRIESAFSSELQDTVYPKP